VFAAQLNEYLDDLQLDREAREMRQPYSAPAETLDHQPTVSAPYQEVVASVPADQVIVAEPAMIEPEPPTPEVPTVSARAGVSPSVLKEPTRTAEPSYVAPPHVIEPTRIIEAAEAIEPPLVIDPAIIESPRVVESARVVEQPRVVEPPRAFETTRIEDAPTAEPTRLIAPSPIAEPRRSVAKPARTESIIEPAGDPHEDRVAEPSRLIAPSPAAGPTREAPPMAAHVAEPKSPKPVPKPMAPVGRPAAAAKAKPKVAKVQFVPPPLHEDPEVAKFMAALNDLPTVDVVEAAAGSEPDAAQAGETVAASTVESDLDLNASATPVRQVAEPETPRETVVAPKTVKALKPARTRAISPAAAPPSLPPSARKRVTPIRRGSSAPEPPEPAPEPTPRIESRPAATTSAPVKVVGRIQPAGASPAAPAGARTGKQKASARRPRPVQDEWGFFDPDQAGLPAVQAALDDIEEPDIFRTVSTPPKPRA
jgi:hypothetical protein